MNKTATINLGGQVFTIDDNAYTLLKEYLDTLRVQLAQDDDKDEILLDFERAIAEHLLELLATKHDIITASMVKKVTKAIGAYETTDIADAEPETPPNTAQTAWHRLFKHPIYLDKNNALIGGVSAGIARSLEVDAFWVRLLFILLIISSWGVGIVVYIALMLIMKDPQNMSEQLRAEGFQPTAASLVAHSKKRFQEAQATLNKAEMTDRLAPATHFVKQVLRFVSVTVSGTLITLITTGYVVLIVAWLEHRHSTDQPFNASPGGVNYGLLLSSYLLLVLPLLLVLLVSVSRRIARKTMGLRVSALLFGGWLASLVVFIGAATIAVPDWADWSRQHPTNRYFQLQIKDGHVNNVCVNLGGNCNDHPQPKYVIPDKVEVVPLPPQPAMGN